MGATRTTSSRTPGFGRRAHRPGSLVRVDEGFTAFEPVGQPITESPEIGHVGTDGPLRVGSGGHQPHHLRENPTIEPRVLRRGVHEHRIEVEATCKRPDVCQVAGLHASEQGQDLVRCQLARRQRRAQRRRHRRPRDGVPRQVHLDPAATRHSSDDGHGDERSGLPRRHDLVSLGHERVDDPACLGANVDRRGRERVDVAGRSVGEAGCHEGRAAGKDEPAAAGGGEDQFRHLALDTREPVHAATSRVHEVVDGGAHVAGHRDVGPQGDELVGVDPDPDVRRSAFVENLCVGARSLRGITEVAAAAPRCPVEVMGERHDAVGRDDRGPPRAG